MHHPSARRKKEATLGLRAREAVILAGRVVLVALEVG
jgi:hypothetical protein